VKSLSFVLSLLLFSPIYSITYLNTGQVLPAPTVDGPSPLTFQGSNAAPQIAVSTNGQAMAIWVTFPHQIEIQGMFFDGTNWVPLLDTDGVTPFLLSNLDPSSFATGKFGGSPQLGIDKDGNATIVWVSLTNQIMAAYFNKNILKSVTQLTLSGSSNISPSIAVNQTGFALAVWIQNPPYQVLASTFTPDTTLSTGGTWSSSVLFLPQPFGNQPNGTYPASFGLGTNDPGPSATNNLGTAIWLDAPTGVIYTKTFTVP
jgi:hypothetical protein